MKHDAGFLQNEFLFSWFWSSFASGQLSMQRTSAESSRTHFPQIHFLALSPVKDLRFISTCVVAWVLTIFTPTFAVDLTGDSWHGFGWFWISHDATATRLTRHNLKT